MDDAASSDSISRARDQTFCPQARRRYVLIAAIIASALGFIDGSVVSIAVPAIRSGLDASLTDAQWISNAYMLTLSAFILVGGAAGDRFGLRRVFSAGIALFVVASVACAVAPSASFLIAMRALQGLGAAFMVPGSLAIIAKAYPKGERGRAIGIWAAASAITTAAGPVLGGLLLSVGTPEMWRLIFAINLPLGAFTLYLLLAKVPPDPHTPSTRVDVAGGLLAVATLGCLAWALTGPEGEGGLPGGGHVALWLGATALCFAGFLAVERRATQPVMPLRVFANTTFNAANVATFFLYFALSGVLFYLPMTLIGGWQIAEGLVGLVFVPLTVAIAAMSGPVGALSDKTGPGILIAAGSAIVGLAYAGLAAGMHWMSFWWHVLPMMVLMGFGMGLVVTPLSAAVMGAVAESDTGVASGVNNAVSRVAGLVAVAALGSAAAWRFGLTGAASSFGAELGAEADAVALLIHAEANNAAFAAVAYATAVMCFISAAVALVGIRRT